MLTSRFTKIFAVVLAAIWCASAAQASAPYRVLLSNGGGSCVVGDPDASGVVSGTCTDASGSTFNVSGPAVAQNSANYDVTLRNAAGARPFTVDVSFNTAAQVGSGSWIASSQPAALAPDNTPGGQITVIGSQPAQSAPDSTAVPPPNCIEFCGVVNDASRADRVHGGHTTFALCDGCGAKDCERNDQWRSALDAGVSGHPGDCDGLREQHGEHVPVWNGR